MRQTAALLACFCLLAACASTPTLSPDAPNPHRYIELVPGTSTKADAIAKLGQPNGVTAIRDQTLLQWINTASTQPIHVAILFGPDGRMIRVQHVFSQ